MSGAITSHAAISPIGPFSGTYSETWESFPNVGNASSPTYLNNPTDIMGGFASISSPVMGVYEIGTSAKFSLAPPAISANVSDGTKGMGLDGLRTSASITFDSPVKRFGAYWGAGFGFDGQTGQVKLTFSDGSTTSFFYANPTGDLEWHGWSSDVGITKVTYAGDDVVIDGLQADADPVFDYTAPAEPTFANRCDQPAFRDGLSWMELKNPATRRIQTGDTVKITFTLDPPLGLRNTANTFDIRLMLDTPDTENPGADPADLGGITVTGDNLLSPYAAVGRSRLAPDSSFFSVEMIFFGPPDVFLADPSHDGVLKTVSASFVVPAGIPKMPAEATLIVSGQAVCPATGSPEPVLVQKTDSTGPTASPTQSPAANSAGWNNSDVTVYWNWVDEAGGSGLDTANCTPSSTSTGEGTLTLNATCKDLAGNTGTATYTVKVDKTPPVLTVSPNITVPATSSAGATVSYKAATASDQGGSGVALVSCSPLSGTVFAIGTATVKCTATDLAGNRATSQFTVHVTGGAEQLDSLILAVSSLPKIPVTIKQGLLAKLQAAKAALSLNSPDTATACACMQDFINLVKAQTGKTLSSGQAANLLSAAKQIRAVIGCP
jgi:hypothetical protein